MSPGYPPSGGSGRGSIRRLASTPSGNGRIPLEPWYHATRILLRPPVALWFEWHLEGVERVPARGPSIVAGNHLSYLDPIAHAHFVIAAGRRPRFLAKRELFDHRLLGVVLRGTRQIPVSRGSGDGSPLADATRALEAGEILVIYPEGTTTTTNADFSPGSGRTGAVRLSLATGVPVLPVATWGGQYVWRRAGRQSLAPRRPIWLRAGEPFDARARAGAAPASRERVRELTDELMGGLASIVDGLRERYPASWASGTRDAGGTPEPRG